MTATLHPWNDGFEWAVGTPPYHVLSDEQVAEFDERGFVVVDDVFDAETLAPVIAEIDEKEAMTEQFLRQMEGERMMIAEADAITFCPNLVLQSEILKAFSLHPWFAGVCHDLIGPDANLYWDQAVYKKPTKPRRFPWHQDNGYTFVRPQQYLTCWVALTEATAQNGCPQVAVGQHRHGTLAHTYIEPLGWECLQDPDDVAVAEVKAGGVVVFSSLTPHLTGPNTTDAVRKSYILQYAPADAVIVNGDPYDGNGPQGETPANDAGRQYPIIRNGQPVT